MVSKKGITQRLYEELSSIIESHSSVSEGYQHVDVHDDWDEETYPSYIFETTTRPSERGFDGSIHVDDVEKTDDGTVTAIIYRKDTVLVTDVTAFADDGDESEKDDLYQLLEDHFSQYNMWKEASDFHSDCRSIDVGGTTDASRPNEAIRGDRFRVEFEYSRYQTFADFEPIERVEQSFDETNETYTTIH